MFIVHRILRNRNEYDYGRYFRNYAWNKFVETVYDWRHRFEYPLIKFIQSYHPIFDDIILPVFNSIRNIRLRIVNFEFWFFNQFFIRNNF